MRTNQSISNISYQSPAFFGAVVDSLKTSGKIGTCYWISHTAEGEDTKDHIHFVLLGGQKTYNTDGLSALFGFEVRPDGSKASVTGLWKVTKKLNDWIAYAIHDPKYLTQKLLDREYHYQWQDLRCSVGDEENLKLSIAETKEFLSDLGDKVNKVLRYALKHGMTWEELATSGFLPVNTLASAAYVWRLLGGEFENETIIPSRS